MKTRLALSLLASLLFPLNTQSSDVGTTSWECPPAWNTGHHVIKPYRCIEPWYPTKAARVGIQGWAEVSFTVTREGLVEDVIVMAEEPSGYYFYMAASSAISRFRFPPVVVDGKALELEDARYTFYFPTLPTQ